MSRRMKEKEEKFSSGASIERASDCLRHIFGKIKWRRKVATLLVAAMLTGTMSDGLAAVGVAGNGNVYASSSNARVEDDSGGGSSQKGKHAADYYLEDAKEDLDLQLDAASLKEAMESDEPMQLDLQYLPFEEEAVLVGAYEEILAQTEGYRLLEQGNLQDDQGKVTYLVFGKGDSESSGWMDNLKVIVLNGNQEASENPGYNVFFTIDGEDLRLTEGQVEIKTFASKKAEPADDSAVTGPSGGSGDSQNSSGDSGTVSSGGEDSSKDQTAGPEKMVTDRLSQMKTVRHRLKRKVRILQEKRIRHRPKRKIRVLQMKGTRYRLKRKVRILQMKRARVLLMRKARILQMKRARVLLMRKARILQMKRARVRLMRKARVLQMKRARVLQMKRARVPQMKKSRSPQKEKARFRPMRKVRHRRMEMQMMLHRQRMKSRRERMTPDHRKMTRKKMQAKRQIKMQASRRTARKMHSPISRKRQNSSFLSAPIRYGW